MDGSVLLVTYTLHFRCEECEHEWCYEEALTANWTESCPGCGQTTEAFDSTENKDN
jgi:hypothetical protein